MPKSTARNRARERKLSLENTASAANEDNKRQFASSKPWSYRQSVIMLVIGDALCFLIFAMLGTRTHGEPSGLAAVPHIVLTSLPFMAGWFIVSPFVGAFRRSLFDSPKAMAIRTALSWLASWPVAMALRGIFVDHGVPPVSFAIVVLLFNLLILEVWRWPFALNMAVRKRRA